MLSSKKIRPLSRYLKDFKHSQSKCAQCGKILDRMALVYQGKIINKEAIAGMDQPMDDATWPSVEKDLLALCRFCSDIFCNSHTRYFDVMGFKQYLFTQTDMNHSTVREYVVRVRRFDEMQVTDGYPVENFFGDEWLQNMESELPEAGNNNYRIAIRKYDQFLQWQRKQA
ncbi:MAG: Regulator of sigma S factor FliZ [Candidatus Erwinia impunctatus]|nr:Regulator of sigma S factor FliZ [Culicoides impunctatus]